jgi:hypothetical protein
MIFVVMNWKFSFKTYNKQMLECKWKSFEEYSNCAFGYWKIKIDKDELKLLKTKDFTKSIVVGSFQNEGYNPHAGKYLISLDGEEYIIPADTVAIDKNSNLSNVALYNMFKNNGSYSKIGRAVGSDDFTDSEYLYTKIFLEGNNPANVPPLGGEFIVSMDDKYDKIIK